MKKTRRLAILLYAGLSLSGLQAAETNPQNQLFQAIRNGDAEQIALLLGAGADPNAVDGDGTPVLMQAVICGDARIVRMLLNYGANPNATNPAGATALIWAAGDPQKSATLLVHGADPNLRSALGRSPLLAVAASSGA